MTKSVIWKQPLALTPVQPIAVPAGAELLTVLLQHDTITVWYRCNPICNERDFETRTILIAATGLVDEDKIGLATARYLGTVITPSGNLVWHVFERKS